MGGRGLVITVTISAEMCVRFRAARLEVGADWLYDTHLARFVEYAFCIDSRECSQECRCGPQYICA